MKLLLLGLTGEEPSFTGWAEWLRGVGVPVDAVALRRRTEPLQFVRDDETINYHAIILAEKDLLELAVEPSERTLLAELEARCGLRRLIAYAYPGAELGLEAPRASGPLEAVALTLTRAGQAIFPYLNGALPVDRGSWVHHALPVDPDFCTLVSGPGGEALVGIHRTPDGRELMVQTFDSTAGQAQGVLLRLGQLGWLTHGTFAGVHRHSLNVHVDDILLANHSWRPDRHETDRRPGAAMRMAPQDVRDVAAWSRARDLRLSFVCNGAGSLWSAAPGAVGAEPLLEALLAERDAFHWINHTFGHADLAEMDRAGIEAEIRRNLDWAASVGIALERRAVVTGEHSGLSDLVAVPPRAENPQLAPALLDQGIRFVACDASKPYRTREGTKIAPGVPFPVGPALAIPRRPTLLPHDAATPAQVLDRLRHHGGSWTSFRELVDTEAQRIFSLVAAGDPLPHVLHQSNLIGARDASTGAREPGTACSLLDAVLQRIRGALVPDVPVLSQTMEEIGTHLLRLHWWRYAQEQGQVSLLLDGRYVHVVNASAVPQTVPLTGVSAAERYGFSRSGWISVDPGETTFEREPWPAPPALRRTQA